MLHRVFAANKFPTKAHNPQGNKKVDRTDSILENLLKAIGESKSDGKLMHVIPVIEELND